MCNDKYVVVRDCFCAHYIHEITNYPREGLKELKLKKDDIVEFVSEFQNFYGYYIRVRKDNNIYDIEPNNLTPITDLSDE